MRSDRTLKELSWQQVLACSEHAHNETAPASSPVCLPALCPPRDLAIIGLPPDTRFGAVFYPDTPGVKTPEPSEDIPYFNC